MVLSLCQMSFMQNLSLIYMIRWMKLNLSFVNLNNFVENNVKSLSLLSHSWITSETPFCPCLFSLIYYFSLRVSERNWEWFLRRAKPTYSLVLALISSNANSQTWHHLADQPWVLAVQFSLNQLTWFKKLN